MCCGRCATIGSVINREHVQVAHRLPSGANHDANGQQIQSFEDSHGKLSFVAMYCVDLVGKAKV